MSPVLLGVIAAAIVLSLLGFIALRRGRRPRAPGLDLTRQSLVFGHAQSPGGGGDRYEAFGFHDPGDAPLLRTLGLVGVVSDGFGEGDLGSAAASTAVSRFLDAIRKAGPAVGKDLSPQAALRRAAEAAEAGVREVASRAEPGERVGATLAAFAAGPGGLHWISVGDSRIWLFRAGRLHQVTLDHTFRTLLARSIAKEQVSPSDAAAKKERDALTGALAIGDALELDANVRTFPLQPNDRVLVGSAGLHRALDPEQIAAVLSDCTESGSKALLAAAAARSPDSVTIIDVFLQSPPAAVREPVAKAEPRTQPGESRLIARGGTTQPSGATAS